MKRLTSIIIFLIILAFPMATKADIKYNVLRLGSALTGNTTSPLGGVSTMAVVEGFDIPRSGTSEIPTGRDPGYGVFELSGITISQAQSGTTGPYSDNTFSVFYKTVLENHASHWNFAERKRLFYNEQLSGATKYSKVFSFPPGSFVRFYWESSGVTAYDNASARVLLGLPDFNYYVDNTRTYLLYLGTSDSGNTTTYGSGSGTSTLVVDGGKYNRSEATYIIDGMEKTDGEFYIFQIETLTISQAAQARGSGNYSGVTLTVRYRESTIDDSNSWAKAQTVDIISGMALSGNTRYQIPIYPEAVGYIRFDAYMSGITPFDNIKAKFKCK